MWVFKLHFVFKMSGVPCRASLHAHLCASLLSIILLLTLLPLEFLVQYKVAQIQLQTCSPNFHKLSCILFLSWKSYRLTSRWDDRENRSMQHFRAASLSLHSVSLHFHLLHAPRHSSYGWVCFFSLCKFSWLQNRIPCSGRPGTRPQLCWDTAQSCSCLTLLCLPTACTSRHLCRHWAEHEWDNWSAQAELTGPGMDKTGKKHHQSLVPSASCCPTTPGGHRAKLLSRGKRPAVTWVVYYTSHSSPGARLCPPELLPALTFAHLNSSVFHSCSSRASSGWAPLKERSKMGFWGHV